MNDIILICFPSYTYRLYDEIVTTIDTEFKSEKISFFILFDLSTWISDIANLKFLYLFICNLKFGIDSGSQKLQRESGNHKTSKNASDKIFP